jgi:acetylornithine deacetylase/succinyl-diaminopimelate desuccinylase-like protein
MHIDTVSLEAYEGNPLSGDIRDGKLYGRGAADMKCGIAAAMVALADSRRMGLRGAWDSEVMLSLPELLMKKQ